MRKRTVEFGNKWIKHAKMDGRKSERRGDKIDRIHSIRITKSINLL